MELTAKGIVVGARISIIGRVGSFLSFLLMTSLAAAGVEPAPLSFNKEFCEKEDKAIESFHKGMFFPDGDLGKRGLSYLLPILEIERSYERIYKSGARLGKRLFLNEETGGFEGLAASVGSEDTYLELPHAVIANLVRHLERSLEEGYARNIFYLDAGHVHLYRPEGEELPSYSGIQRVQKHLRGTELQYLYHTAEKVSLRDPKSKEPLSAEHGWWYENRNVLGFHDHSKDVRILRAQGSGYNTVGSIKGMKGINTGLYFQANEKGCFQLSNKGQKVNFDISFHMPPGDPEVILEMDGK